MTIAEETKCPLRNGQNDSIKDNTNKIILKDKREIDELTSAPSSLQSDSSISETGPELEEISPEALIRMGARYEITHNDLIRIVDTGKLFRIKQ
jgi:hypothetical protein